MNGVCYPRRCKYYRRLTAYASTITISPLMHEWGATAIAGSLGRFSTAEVSNMASSQSSQSNIALVCRPSRPSVAIPTVRGRIGPAEVVPGLRPLSINHNQSRNHIPRLCVGLAGLPLRSQLSQGRYRPRQRLFGPSALVDQSQIPETIFRDNVSNF